MCEQLTSHDNAVLILLVLVTVICSPQDGMTMVLRGRCRLTRSRLESLKGTFVSLISSKFIETNSSGDDQLDCNRCWVQMEHTLEATVQYQFQLRRSIQQHTAL